MALIIVRVLDPKNLWHALQESQLITSWNNVIWRLSHIIYSYWTCKLDMKACFELGWKHSRTGVHSIIYLKLRVPSLKVRLEHCSMLKIPNCKKVQNGTGTFVKPDSIWASFLCEVMNPEFPWKQRSGNFMVGRWSLPNYMHSFLWNYPQITSEPTNMIPVSFYDNILLFSSKQFLHNWQFIRYISRPSNAFYLTSADCTIVVSIYLISREFLQLYF